MADPWFRSDEPDGHGPEVARQRAQALMQTHRSEDARRVLSDAVARHPDDWQVRVELARCLLDLDLADEALVETEQALVRAPDAEWAHRVRALALIRLDRAADAVDAARAAVVRAPYAALTHVMLSQALRQDRRLDDAIDEAREAVRLAPSDPAPYESLGRCQMAKGDAEAAEATFRHVLGMTPEDPAAINNLAIALQRQNREKEAVALFAQAAALDPSEPVYRRNVGVSADRLTGSVVPIGAALIFGVIVNPIVGLIGYLAFSGWKAARRARLRRTARGVDGQLLPAGIWLAYDDYRRHRRRQVVRTIVDPRRWWTIMRRPLQADPFEVNAFLVFAMAVGFTSITVGALLDSDPSGDVPIVTIVFEALGFALAIGAPVALFITARTRRRRAR